MKNAANCQYAMTIAADRPLRRFSIDNPNGLGGIMHNGTPAQKRLGFRIHAMAFVPAIIALLIVNYFTGAPYWVQWVVLGWGIGLLSHWFFVLGPGAGRRETT